jgi:hypothetical protein
VLASQIAIKLFAAPGATPDHEALIPIFHRWIREHRHRLCGKLLIDVADYRHVQDGPGVVLIGHEAHWGVGGLAGGLGLHYARKRDAAGELAGKLVEALHDSLTVAGMLEAESTLGLRFDPSRARVQVMSRLHADNSEAAVAAARPEVAAVAARLWGPGASVSHAVTDPRAPLTLDVAGTAGSVAELLARLA